MKNAFIEWQNNQPYSSEYQDIYFSVESGIEETRHVFLVQNQLESRWKKLSEGEVFVIGETGFGTGLNFLCAWQLWNQIASEASRLHYVSTELYPLTPADLSRALSLWPELHNFAENLIGQYADLSPGWHRLSFEQGRVTLTLLIGDAAETLPQLQASVNAWFLDGFAPSRNPEMWQPKLLETIAACSAHEATFSTFTSAGEVRRTLEAVGFKVEKVAGYGKKRDMLRGQIHKTSSHVSPILNRKEATIIGAGLAGCATAYSLSVRGWKVTLIDRHPKIANEASGNSQGILYARLSPRMSPLSEFALLSYQHALRTIKQLLPEGDDTWRRCGLFQFAFNEAESFRLKGVGALGLPESLLVEVSAQSANEMTGLTDLLSGVYFPEGAWVYPMALCQALLAQEAITLKTGIEITTLEGQSDGWRLMSGDDIVGVAPVVIVAGAVHTQRFSQFKHLPLRSIRGQVSHVPATARSRQLEKVLCTEGYVAPQRHGYHTLGATYGNFEETTELRPEDHAENLAMLTQLSPSLSKAMQAENLNLDTLGGRASCRCNVADYLPIVGSVSDDLSMLWVNTGHGSRGLITSLISAELLASALNCEPLPLPTYLADAMSPSRFNGA